MVRAELKRLRSPDAWDLRAFTPARAEYFGLLVQAMVGPAGSDDEESFDLMVCTPAWLAEQVETKGPLLGRHHVVVAVYDYSALEQFVRAFCEAMAEALSRTEDVLENDSRGRMNAARLDLRGIGRRIEQERWL